MDGFVLLGDLLSTSNPASLFMVFVFGTLLGSFVNVCIGRMPVTKSIVWPGSACGECGVPLAWWQNVPLASYIGLGARCNFCGSVIGPRYLLLEVLTGLVAVSLFASTHTEAVVDVHGPLSATYVFVYQLVFACLLIIVFFIDLDAWIILDEINYFGIAAGVLGAWLLPPQYGFLAQLGYPVDGHLAEATGGWQNLAWSMLGAGLGFALFSGIALLGSLLARQEAMGRGDVKLAALIGAFLGPQRGVLALLLSFPLGAAVALPLILIARRGSKTPVPFGTFMAVAAYVVMLFGDALLRMMLPFAL